MARKIMEDMVRVKKELPRSFAVDDFVGMPPESKRHKKGLIDSEEFEELASSPKDGSKRNSSPAIWLLAIVAVFILLASLSFFFGEAQVSIKPKVIETTLNSTFEAGKGNASPLLPFNLIIVEGVESKEVSGSLREDVKENAKGVAILYNAFSNSPQTLDINTRLEGSNGKIYKTEKRIVVPGMKKDGTPGSIEVGIYAALPGEGYNTGPIDFKILGFKGTPKYEKFYGRTKGSIAGGLAGNTLFLDDIAKQETVKELRQALRAKLSTDAKKQIPSGFILFESANVFSAEEENIKDNIDTKKVLVSVKGTFYGFIFNTDEITDSIIKNNLKDIPKGDTYIPDLGSLDFSLVEKTGSFSDIEKLSFKLVGNVKVVYRVDEEKLKLDLLGKNKRYFNQILSPYDNIESALLVVRPSWRKTLPEKSRDIEVIVESVE